MKATVIKPYTDKFTDEIHLATETVELAEARAKELSALGYVEIAEEPKKPASKPRPRKAPAKKAE
ncbi:hypothetical protein [Slackia piriformis]|uniref:hypothetical protein n=1 Tax=Slackia piriformis TaxID=626934 RepID=UPI0023EFEAA7|nr:hypothetical protein [Slackia piriformis]